MANWRRSSPIGPFTFSGLPSASSLAAGIAARVTNIGIAGSIWMTDGTRWTPENGRVSLAQFAIPMVLPSSGSIGDNGALTGIAALQQTYASCYMYFPANAIASGVAAGLYYVVMSSTTAGTIYNNTYTSGNPTIPSSPTAFAATGPGAFTQTTASDITLVSITLPGGAMGLSGRVIEWVMTQNNNSANDKITKTKLGTTTFCSNIATTTISSRLESSIQNQGTAASQLFIGATSGGALSPVAGSSVSSSTSTENTASDISLLITGQLETDTDTLVISGVSMELLTQ